MLKIPVHLFGTLYVPPQTAREDIPNLEAEIRDDSARAFAVAEGDYFINGNSVAKPEGMLTNSSVSATTSQVAGKVRSADLVSIQDSLKEPYQANATWLMRRATRSELRLLEGSDGRMLWQPALTAGVPDTLLGNPIVVCPDMPAFASGAYPIVYGDIRAGYQIVDKSGVFLQVLDQLYAPLVGFFTRRQLGGAVQMAEAIKKLLIKS
jgi:HK97 family phage major capsid protein